VDRPSQDWPSFSIGQIPRTHHPPRRLQYVPAHPLHHPNQRRFDLLDSPPNEDGYKNITSPAPLPSGKPSFTFRDTYTHLHARSTTHAGQSAPYGPAHTYTGFTAPGKTKTDRIDFVMLAALPDAESDEEGGVERGDGTGKWTVERYACIDNWVEEGDSSGWQGRWSDHRAVRVKMVRV
jgi:hypothetical protein